MKQKITLATILIFAITHLGSITVSAAESYPFVQQYGIDFSHEYSFSHDFDIQFVDSGITSPMVYPGYTLNKGDGTVQIVSASKTPSAESGYDDIEIIYGVSFSATFFKNPAQLQKGLEKFYCSWTTPGFYFFDGYTGMQMPDSSISVGETSVKNTMLSWNGTSYPISITKSIVDNGGLGSWRMTVDQQYFATYSNNVYTSLTFHIPSGYDGLVMYMENACPQMANNITESEVEPVTYMFESSTPDEYIYFNVEELIQALN